MNHVALYASLSVSFSSLSFLALLSYLVLSHRQANKGGASLLSTFPPEVFERGGLPIRTLLVLSSALSFASLACLHLGIILSTTSLLGPASVKVGTYFSLLLSTFLPFAMYATGSMGFRRSVKVPIALELLFFMTALGIGLMAPAVASYEIPGEGGEVLAGMDLFFLHPIVGWVFFGLFALFALQLFNPKLKDWYRMDKAEEDGSVYLVRPRVNWLASMIWSGFLLVSLYQILIAANGIAMLF